MNGTTSNNLHAQVLEVGDHDFEARVLQSSRPVVVDFTADSCPPCRALAPLYHRLSGEFAEKLDFALVDLAEHGEVASRLGVRAMPTLIFFQHGRELARVVGPHPTRLKFLIEEIVAKNNL